MDFQIIKDLGNTSIFHPNLLGVLETLTATKDGWPDKEIERWNNYAMPIKFFANNDSIPTAMRPALDAALTDIEKKSDSKIQFTEVFSEPDTGVVFRYRTTEGMPCPGASGCAYLDEFFLDESLKHATIYINTQIPPVAYGGVFRRELMRTMPTDNLSLDPQYIMSFSSQATELHPDEGKALQIMYTLNHNTNMRPHRQIAVNDLLPVELVIFTAKINGKDVELNWQTATEINNYGFEVERIINNYQWDNIGFVEGNGNSNSPKYYSYTDKHPQGGNKLKYRLKQVDTDGQFEYSNDVEVDFIIKDFSLSQNYPNPFNPSTTIGFQLEEINFVTLKIYDVLGNEIATLLNEEKLAGTYDIEFNSTGLSSGIYFYKLQAGDFVQSKKMILLK
ncbi:MAG: T9SS type A sorting domain-containing protein [Ignavibacteriales bacterium]|nr:T9SS type A sorting domain-containing protein [Ignavibacteriales bacterium]